MHTSWLAAQVIPVGQIRPLSQWMSRLSRRQELPTINDSKLAENAMRGDRLAAVRKRIFIASVPDLAVGSTSARGDAVRLESETCPYAHFSV